MIKITPEDRKWLRRNHAGMVAPSCDTVEGVFRVRAILSGYREVSNCLGIPDESLLADGKFVEDKFKISVHFADNDLPQVKEIGGRFQACAEKMSDETGKSMKECLWDLHIYEDSVLCLGHKTTLHFVLKNYPGMQGFFDYLLAPYFFFHAYWKKHGRQPWPGLSHNPELATLEEIYYARQDIELLKEHLFHIEQAPSSILYLIQKKSPQFFNRPICFCGSGKYMEKCHAEAFKGAKILAGIYG